MIKKRLISIAAAQSIIDLSLENISFPDTIPSRIPKSSRAFGKGRKKAQTPGEINKVNVIRFPKR